MRWVSYAKNKTVQITVLSALLLFLDYWLFRAIQRNFQSNYVLFAAILRPIYALLVIRLLPRNGEESKRHGIGNDPAMFILYLLMSAAFIAFFQIKDFALALLTSRFLWIALIVLWLFSLYLVFRKMQAKKPFLLPFFHLWFAISFLLQSKLMQASVQLWHSTRYLACEILVTGLILLLATCLSGMLATRWQAKKQKDIPFAP